MASVTPEVVIDSPPVGRNGVLGPSGLAAPSHHAAVAGKAIAPAVDSSGDSLLRRPALATIFWLGIMHLGALAAFWTFSWQGVVLAVVLHWLTGGIGICMGFHRLFTHRSFSTSRPVRWLIALIGSLAGEGSVVYWVANHRKHHAHSDQPGDPHSPRDGAWWSHMFWTMLEMNREDYKAYVHRWTPDLLKDPVIMFIDRTFILWHFLFGTVLFAAGYYFGGAALGWSLVVWGMFVRLVFVLHATWFVNSASHMWGYRTYETPDDSRNLWWVALITYGEGWHNNHHAYPSMARAGHKWWEVDVTFATIRLLEKLGIVWNVVDGHHEPARPSAKRSPRRGKELAGRGK
jgi:fatty-acid desaturase